MANYSDSFSFKNINIDEIIRDAYERIGIGIDKQTADNIISAKRSLNFILTSWINQGLNLWTIRYKLFSLINGQSKYEFPAETSDVLEVFYRFFERVTDTYPGIAIPEISNAANLFNNSSDTCIISATDYAGYKWSTGSTPTVCYVGILVNTSGDYSFVIQGINDASVIVYNFIVPSDTYSDTEIKWIEVPKYLALQQLTIKSAVTADITLKQLYFCSYPTDRIITRCSRNDYMSMPNKDQGGTPNIYYLDRNLIPNFYIWPVFSYTQAGVGTSNMACLGYTYVEMPQSVETLLESPAIVWRFLEALTAALAFKLAIKNVGVDMQKTQYLETLAAKEFGTAFGEDKERVPLRIYGSYT